jgi:8-oxo-dGTP diphosphatase
MIERFLSVIWRKAPRLVRRWGVRLVQPRFMVTVGAVILDGEGRVLLLKHVFRPGAGWGIPGGFINRKEDPESALRRELAEEIGIELEGVEVAFARNLGFVDQVEIIYRCDARGEPNPRSVEVSRLGWFRPGELPEGISSDQKMLISRVMNGTKR